MSPKPDIALPNLDLGSYPSRMSFFFCRNFLCLTKIKINRTFNQDFIICLVQCFFSKDKNAAFELV